MGKPQRIGSDDGERKTLADIAEFGWHSVNVLEDDGYPPWTFTIGLYETGNHPELIIVGRSRASAVLHRAGPFVLPCTRPATASQRRDSDAPPGVSGATALHSVATSV